MAGWQSGYAAACKAVDAGSIPTPASNARVVKLVDTRDLKSLAEKSAYRFDSGSGHQLAD